MSIETKTLQQKANSPLAQITSSHRIMTVDTSGNIDTATAATVGNAITSGMDINALEDGVFIMFHRKLDNRVLLVKPHLWEPYQSSGEIADGVVLFDGSRRIVIAPTEAPTTLVWSSTNVAGGGFTTKIYREAIADTNGLSNNTAQRRHGECNTENYAVGYCSTYSRTNTKGQGITAGLWWLPSLSELITIYANMARLNYALSLISGATLLTSESYWSSTEYDENSAWICMFNHGLIIGTQDYGNKASGLSKVRPVSELQ